MFTTRILRFTLEGMWRNLWLSFMTVSTMVLTLVLVNLLVTLQVGVNEAIQAAERRIDLNAYFIPTATDDQIQSTLTAVQGLPGVTSVSLLTKEDALARYRQRAKSSPELIEPLEVIGGNPFGASLVIRVNQVKDFPAISEALAQPPYAQVLESQQREYEDSLAFVQGLTGLTDNARRVVLILSAILAAIAMLLLFNNIRVAIYTHREEIGVMKLVGATNWFVRAPFLLETVFYCVVATVISIAVTVGILAIVQPSLTTYFSGEVNVQAAFAAHMAVTVLTEFAIALVVCVLASSIAMHRYLRV